MPGGGLWLAALVAIWLAAVTALYRGLFMDDAWIGLRSVAHLLAGQGLVFNPGERVEGVTNAGWLLLLAPFAHFSSPPFAAKLLAVAGLGITLVLLYRVASSLGETRGAFFAPLVVLVAATDADLVSFSLLGMETAALAAVLTAMVWIAVRGRGFGALPFLGAFAFLLHPEAVLVFPAMVLLALLFQAAPARRLLSGLLPYAGLLAGITALRFAYFGALLPNTWGAKPPTVRAVLGNLLGALDGSAVNLGFPFAGALSLALLGIGFAALLRSAPLAAAAAGSVVGTGFVFALYARPDWTELGRYFAPYAPAALLLGGTGAVAAARGRALRRFAPHLAPVLLALALIATGAATTVRRTGEAERLGYPGYILTAATLVPPALWIRDHLPPGALIATRRIGALGYHSGHPVFDYAFGLTEPAVAALIRGHGGPFDDPNAPELAALWARRAPAYLLEEADLVARWGAASTGSARRGEVHIHGGVYRVIRRFPIGRGVEWVLLERSTCAACAASASDADRGRGDPGGRAGS